MTSGVDRATLPLMGRQPDENILSIDDGVPYYPGSDRHRGVAAPAGRPLRGNR